MLADKLQGSADGGTGALVRPAPCPVRVDSLATVAGESLWCKAGSVVGHRRHLAFLSGRSCQDRVVIAESAGRVSQGVRGE